jgi:hypothetical protein
LRSNGNLSADDLAYMKQAQSIFAAQAAQR